MLIFPYISSAFVEFLQLPWYYFYTMKKHFPIVSGKEGADSIEHVEDAQHGAIGGFGGKLGYVSAQVTFYECEC